MEIGKQIKKHRTQMNLSQEQLSEKIFVSRQTISNWENNKNYPDMKSLLLLSDVFDVSLDNLIKGDVEKMQDEINNEDLNKMKKESNIFAILLISCIVLPVPLIKYMDGLGLMIWFVLFIPAMYYAFKIEKNKKKFDIQTFKEIMNFMEGKTISEIEKHQEYGKRTYQQILLVIGLIVVAIIISIIMLKLFI